MQQIFRLTRKLTLHVHRTPVRTIDAFDPAKHPRGHQGNVGQFAKGGGGTTGVQRQQQETRATQTSTSALKGDLGTRIQPQSDTQNVSSLDDLYNKAKADEPNFVNTIKNMAEAVGGEAEFTPPEFTEPGTTLKSRKSAERKVQNELGGDPSQLRDVLRATIVSQKIEDVRAAAAKFMEANKANIVKVKDRIVNPAPGGYRDILINFRTPNGLISEVQFNTPVMIKAKLGDGHRIYEAVRVLEARKSGGGHARMKEFLKKKSEQLYDGAYQAGGNGNWGTA